VVPDFFETISFTLDRCHSILNGRRFFPFASDLYTLFFERAHATQPGVPLFLARPMFDVCMCMWGKLLPKKGSLEFLYAPVGGHVCDVLAREENHVLDIV
jgi:hypothetical protein